MRLYFPHDGRISRAMWRIRDAFMKHAPQGTEFIKGFGPGEKNNVVHCIHWVGQNPKEHTKRDEGIFSVDTLPLTPRYLVFGHAGNWHYGQFDSHYQRLMKEAALVITFDRRILGYEGSNIFETPWGYEPDTFYRAPCQKRFKVMATGYAADAEAIDACYDACLRMRVKMCHIGCQLPGIPGLGTCERYEHIKDHKMRELYNASEYVSGMRREGGFELPVIEGYACGAQPVVFDQPTMHKYYEDFAVFVPNIKRFDLSMKLEHVFRQPRNVQPSPDILKRFHWAPIMKGLWDRVKEAF